MLLFGNAILSVLYLLVAVNYIILFYLPKKRLEISSKILMVLSILLHLSFLIFIGLTEGRLALMTIFEVFSMVALLLTIMILGIELKTGEKSMGAFIFPFVFCLQCISVIGKRIPMLDESIMTMPLLSFHSLTTVIGYTCFIYSFILALMYFALVKRFKKKKYDSIFFVLPPLERLEKLNILAQVTGLILLSLGLASGAWLSVLVWKRIPLEDPKIILTICLWLIYLINLLFRSFLKQGSHSINSTSIAGFSIIIIIILLESLTQATMHKF